MKIIINDSPVECQDGASISTVLEAQGISARNIAVAMDNTVIPKTKWDTTFVKEGSEILIIKAVQGG